MTATEALRRTESGGYNHIMCCIAAKCDEGFSSIRFYPEVIDRFRVRLETDGYTINGTEVSWSKPKIMNCGGSAALNQ